jgi:hypothetical protein
LQGTCSLGRPVRTVKGARFHATPVRFVRNPPLTFILLRNQQNNRISYADVTGQEDLAHAIQPLFFSRPRQAGPWAGPTFRVMEMALKHKYNVGETVYFTASNVARPAASGTYEVIRLLPTDGDDCQYRIKNSTEAFERVAKESQLAIS